MRCLDIVFAFPMVLLAIAIAGAMRPGALTEIIAITIVLIACLLRGHSRCGDRRGGPAGLPVIALGMSKEKPLRSEARCARGTVALRERDGTLCVPSLAKAVAVLLMRR